MNKVLSVAIIIAVLVGVGAFYGGIKYSESKNPRGQFSRTDLQNLSSEERQQRLQELGANIGGAFGGDHTGGFRGGSGNRGGFTAGEIISKDDASITVKISDGGSRIIFYSDSTEISQFIDGDFEDLEVGKMISVSGQTNSDGSITAQTIQVRPIPTSAPTHQ